MILCNRATDVAQIGGKAMVLLSLQMPNTPPLTVVPVSYFEGQRQEAVLQQELDAWLEPDKCYAVRSSAVAPWWFSLKEFSCSAGDEGSIPESGRSPGEGNGNPF